MLIFLFYNICIKKNDITTAVMGKTDTSSFPLKQQEVNKLNQSLFQK